MNIQIDKQEVLRYLGHSGQKIEPEMAGLVDECIQRTLDCIQPRWVYRRFPLQREGDKLRLGDSQVRLRGEVVPLTAKEFEILSLLAESPGEVFTRRRIYEHLWGEAAEVDENSITVFMRKIREKIEDNPSEPRYLLTVWRVGYKLADE